MTSDCQRTATSIQSAVSQSAATSRSDHIVSHKSVSAPIQVTNTGTDKSMEVMIELPVYEALTRDKILHLTDEMKQYATKDDDELPDP